MLVAAEASAVRGAATGKAANRLGLATLLLRRADAERACGRIEVARQCFRRAVDEAGASRESMADVPSLAALFDDPDFAVDRSRR